jgi:ATP-dependent Clp protease ATP-binding subunit ClpA
VHRCHDARRVPQVHREGQCTGPTLPGDHRRPDLQGETIEILKGLRDRYEEHHRVQITDDAIAGRGRDVERYITARCLPDKAIDVIDEAGARVRLRNDDRRRI